MALNPVIDCELRSDIQYTLKFLFPAPRRPEAHSKWFCLTYESIKAGKYVQNQARQKDIACLILWGLPGGLEQTF